jgi:aminoglycoside phosphotransferase family enzyme/predicted kinase
LPQVGKRYFNELRRTGQLARRHVSGIIFTFHCAKSYPMDERQIQSLLQIAAYPDPADDIRLIQTHVSWIFLAGEFAYKIKKPVNFGFLDFSTLDLRRFYCQEELRLNRRLCPAAYLAVVEVHDAGDGAAFHGNGAVIDYAVKMLRLPEERMADRLLAEDRLSADDVKKIAATVAVFHQKALTGGEIDRFGSLETIRRNWDENFQQAEEFSGITITRQDLDIIQKWAEQFMATNGELFCRRVAGGFIRECDGDLHLENICLTGKVCIFDCIEFNSRFRYSDTAADIAFLTMDLEFHGRRDLARIFLEEYLVASGDPGVCELIDFYAVYRAFVRGKVESFRLKDSGIPLAGKEAAKEKAARYFRLARGYVLRGRLTPSLVVISGLSGSGKTSIAAALARELGLELLSSDRIRKELAGIPLRQHCHDQYGSGLYSKTASEATYLALLHRADQALAAGNGVIIDATCQKRAVREELRELATRHGVQQYLFVAHAPEEVIRMRLTERERQGTDISDGRWEIYLRQREEFEPIVAGEEGAVALESSAPLNDTLDVILKAMRLV